MVREARGLARLGPSHALPVLPWAQKDDGPMNSQAQSRGLHAELRLMVERMLEVWRLVPGEHKRALGIAALLMAIVSVCNTGVALFLGWMVDGVSKGAQQGASATS